MNNISMYLVNASLIFLVIRQIREHPLDARSLMAPVLAVGCAAVLFLHSVPAGGSDLVLEAACVAAGAVMGAIGGLATRLRLGADGRPLGRAGVVAAGMWVGGVGARLAFAVAAGNGAGPAIARFSVAHHITGSAAWVAALVMMALADVLTRLAVIYLRGRRLAAAPAAPRPASRQASVADLESRPAAVHTVSVKARLAAAGLGHGAARPGPPPAPDGGEHASARVAEARSRARERGDRQRQALRPLGVVFLAVVVTASAQAHPAPGLHGAGLAVAAAAGGVCRGRADRGQRRVGPPRPGRAGRGHRADRRLRGGAGRLAAARPGRDSGQPGRVDRRGPAAGPSRPRWPPGRSRPRSPWRSA